MLKYSINSIRVTKSFATFLVCLLTCGAFSQSANKQIIRVEKMEYDYDSNILESANSSVPNANFRVILATDEAIAEKMKQSILAAINARWNAVVLNPKLKLRPIDHVFNSPNFRTKLKDKTPGSWHLFFQIVDNGPYPLTDKKKNWLSNTGPAFESLDYAPYYMRFKALIVDGNDESVIFSNEMMVEMQRSSVPKGQILLRKIPALTDSFLQAFDNAVQTFFSNSPQKELKLEVTPACLFLDVDKTLSKAKKLNFVAKNDSTIEQLQLKQEWTIQKSRVRKTKRVNNFGNNLFNSTLTTLTGIGTEKIRAMRYTTKFGFVDAGDSTHYFCEIPYVEEIRREKEREPESDVLFGGNYLNGNSTVSRYFDPEKKCYLIREKDTIGSFKIRLGKNVVSKNHFSQSWDGTNESSISPIPEFWNNPPSGQNSATPYILEGELYKIPFVIENSKAGNQTDIEIDGQEMATLKIYNNKPVFGLLYSTPADDKIFNILMMLSTLPFNSMQ